MNVLLKAVLLFGLNLLDALLTLIWVRGNAATEGNGLMASVLALGDETFLVVKILIGTLALLVFYRWAHLRISNFGVSLAVVIYLLLMGVHLVTGVSAFAQ